MAGGLPGVGRLLEPPGAFAFGRRNDGFGLTSGAGVAPLGIFDINGRPGLMMPRYAAGSKSIAKYNSKTKRVTLTGTSRYLNERSIQDLDTILALMEKNRIKVNDLQFLIGYDGKVVINDPLAIIPEPPSDANKRMIRKLIEAAKENRK